MKLGDLTIQNLSPVVKGRPLTKARRLSLKGTIDNNKTIKIFECASDNHATFVNTISNEGGLSSFLPYSYQAYQNFVICDWVEGRTINERLPILNTKRIESFFVQSQSVLKLLHATYAPKDCGFDYLEDFIVPRFKHACDCLGLNHLKDSTLDAISALSRENKVLSHADLKPSNIVFNHNGQMIIIDNELLGCTSIPALDEINMLQGLSPAIVKSFRTPIQQTLKNALDIVSSEQQNDLFAVWSARKIGSLFVAGKIDEILSFSSCDIETRKQNLPLWRTLTNLSS